MRRVLIVGLLLAALTPMTTTATAAPPGHRQPVVPCSRGLVALTFDDGPSPTVTPPLVRLLRRLDVPATFFMVGSRVEAYPEVAQLVERNGFTIGNHTWAHTDLTTQTNAEIQQAMRSTRKAMLAAGLHPTDLARPPYGATNPRVERVLTGLGYSSVLWTIDSLDWTGLSFVQIREGIAAAVHPHRTNLVLQHDGVTNSPATLRALPTEIAGLRQRGYCFAALDDTGDPTPPVPLVEITAAQPHVAEGGTIRLSVHLDRPTSRPTTVRVQGRTLRFGVGEQTRHLTVHAPQDGIDEHGEQLPITVESINGVQVGAPVSLPVVDDDPPPVISVGDVAVDASPLLTQTVQVPVRLDRTSDQDIGVVARTQLGPATTTVPAGARTATLEITVPVGTPRDAVREILVRIAGATPGALVVRPPKQTRAQAIRAAFAQVVWPRVTLRRLF